MLKQVIHVAAQGTVAGALGVKKRHAFCLLANFGGVQENRFCLVGKCSHGKVSIHDHSVNQCDKTSRTPPKIFRNIIAVPKATARQERVPGAARCARKSNSAPRCEGKGRELPPPGAWSVRRNSAA